MDIKEYLRTYPEVHVASLSDNEAILNFFTQSAIQGKGLGLVYDRSPHFFAFLDLHSKDSLALIYRGKNNEIQGVATFVFREGYVDGKLARVCYLGDLRVGFDRKASVLWRKIYGEFFKYRHEINQFKDVKKFYTCLIDDNKLSQKSLARNKKSGFSYHHVAPYSMINLMFKWRKNVSKEFVVETPLEVHGMLDFYRSNENHLTAGYEYSREIPERLKNWPDLSMQDFLTVKFGSEIVATGALWAPSACKKILLTRTPLSLRFLFSLLRLFSWGRISVQNELKVLYVTHLVFKKDLSTAQREKAFAAFLNKSWEIKAKKGYHFLGFSDFHRSSLKRSASAFLFNETKMAIYEVNGRDEPAPPNQDLYGFEMALV